MNDQPRTIVYDANCAFCRRQIARIQSWDNSDRFEYLPADSDQLPQRFPQLAQQDLRQGMRLIDPEGQVYVGADAVHAIAAQLPRTRPLAWLYRVPGLKQLFRAAYRWVAANRHRLAASCDDDACSPR